MKLSSLKSNPDNPRTITKESVQRLIDKIIKGYNIPSYRRIAYDSSNENVILAGNQRFNCFNIISSFTASELKNRINSLFSKSQSEDRKNAYLIFRDIARTKSIPFDWVQDVAMLTDDQKNQLLIVDNVPDGDWNFDMLANSFDVAQLNDWGVEGIGNFIEPNFDDLIADKKEKPPSLKITFVSIDDLSRFRDALNLEDYEGAYFSVSAGEL